MLFLFLWRGIFSPFFGLTVLFFHPVEVVTPCEWACLAQAQVSVHAGWHTKWGGLSKGRGLGTRIWIYNLRSSPLIPEVCCSLLPNLFPNSELLWNQREGESRKRGRGPISHHLLGIPNQPGWLQSLQCSHRGFAWSHAQIWPRSWKKWWHFLVLRNICTAAAAG